MVLDGEQRLTPPTNLPMKYTSYSLPKNRETTSAVDLVFPRMGVQGRKCPMIIRLGQAMSGPIRSDQIRSGRVWSDLDPLQSSYLYLIRDRSLRPQALARTLKMTVR